MTMQRSTPRPGGRSARVQAAVHRAANALLAEQGRAALTVPLVAARAGVTPSTIYRRWGDLGELLADVAVERLRPEGDPADTGSVAGDLQAWAEQYLDEMSADVGLTMMRDVLTANGAASRGGAALPGQCAAFTAAQVEAIVARGIARGEPVPAVDLVMDTVVSPIVYHALFGPAPMARERLAARIEACVRDARVVRRREPAPG